MVERVLLASPRGYCAGVERAVETVERALELYGTPVYVRKQIVHNLHVVRELEERGAIFVEDETEVHVQARRYAAEGYFVILIGHAHHEEVVGTMGEIPGSIVLVESIEDVATLAFPEGTKLAYVTQTTLSVDETRDVIAALRARFPT